MNLCTFVGRVTRDPEIRYSQDSQMAIAKFVLAVDRNYKAAEGEETADFFPCVAFDKRAEFAEKHLYKGIRIAINGKMRNNNYTNRNGEKVYGNSLYVDNIEFADGKRDEGQELPTEAAGMAGTGGQAAGVGAAQRTGRTSGAGMSQSAGRTAAAGTGQAAREGVNQPSGRAGTGRTGTIQAANQAARTGTAGAAGQAARTGAAGRTAGSGAAQGAGQAGGNGSAQAGARSAAAGQRTAANRTAARGAASGAAAAGRSGAARGTAARGASAYGDGFMSIPDGIEDEGLPFH